MAQTINMRIVLRNDSTVNWNANSTTVLFKGEIGIEFLDSGKVKMKVGNGTSTWAELPYFGGEEANLLKVSVESGEDHETAIATAAEGITLAKGDIAVVTEATVENGAEIQTGYIYDGTNWVAMSGNVNAKNVYFDSDLTTTTAMGNITLTGGQATIPAAGKNLIDVFNTIYVKEDFTGLKRTNPSASLSGSLQYLEIGSASASQSVALTFEDGAYKYGYTSEEGSEGDTASTVVNNGSTGCAVLTTGGYKFGDTVQDGNTYTISSGTKTTKGNLSLSAAINYSAGKTPVSNLKKMYPTQAFAAGTCTASKELFRWYIPMWAGFTYSESVIADHTNITAEQVKSLTKITGETAYNQTKTTSATATKAWRQYFLAFPKAYGWVMKNAKDGNNIDCTVLHANDVTININGTDVVYSVYYINNAADYGTLAINWSL